MIIGKCNVCGNPCSVCEEKARRKKQMNQESKAYIGTKKVDTFFDF